jgi:very-short-patch-repair endonuclease
VSTLQATSTHPATLRSLTSLSLRDKEVKNFKSNFLFLCLRTKRKKNILLFLAVQSITELCRELRQRETPAERVLWYHLRNRKLFDHKFLRQYPICAKSTFDKDLYYIPDFYCAKAKLVIEADGSIHQLKKEYDKNRDEVLGLLGLTILRFENRQILTDIRAVLTEINKHL